jgi:dihydrofolate synthase/folylpolyglutamate synthase
VIGQAGILGGGGEHDRGQRRRGTPDYESAEEYLRACAPYARVRTLGRTRALLERLGRPQTGLRTVHVVGTSGKSSTSRMAGAILTGHGLHVGTFVSPAIVSLTDLILIEGRPVGEQAFASAVDDVAHAERDLTAEELQGQRVTWFEALLAAALLLFRRARVDVAVIEAGVGGRDDPTNVVNGEVCVLTSVGLDHVAVLGPTTEQIAANKLGIISDGCTLVLGSVVPAVRRQAEAAAERCGARVVVGPTVEDQLGVPPDFPSANFETAALAAQAMIGPLDAATVDGLRDMTVPGRLELVADRPRTFLDAAHNPLAMRALARALTPKLTSGRRCAVIGAPPHRDHAELFAPLFSLCDEVVLTQQRNDSLEENVRTLAAATRHLPGRFGAPLPQTVAINSPAAAMRLAAERAGPRGMVIVAGSTYLITDLQRQRARPHCLEEPLTEAAWPSAGPRAPR